MNADTIKAATTVLQSFFVIRETARPGTVMLDPTAGVSEIFNLNPVLATVTDNGVVIDGWHFGAKSVDTAVAAYSAIIVGAQLSSRCGSVAAITIDSVNAIISYSEKLNALFGSEAQLVAELAAACYIPTVKQQPTHHYLSSQMAMEGYNAFAMMVQAHRMAGMLLDAADSTGVPFHQGSIQLMINQAKQAANPAVGQVPFGVQTPSPQQQVFVPFYAQQPVMTPQYPYGSPVDLRGQTICKNDLTLK